jgi:hypothetical protein
MHLRLDAFGTGAGCWRSSTPKARQLFPRTTRTVARMRMMLLTELQMLARLLRMAGGGATGSTDGLIGKNDDVRQATLI